MGLRRTFAVVLSMVAVTVSLGFGASAASAAPAVPPVSVAADCNGYQPYAYPPYREGADVIKGIGGCGFQVVNVEIWIDKPWAPDVRAACCPRGYSPVIAYAYCSRTGAGNYYTVAYTPVGTIESERRWLC